MVETWKVIAGYENYEVSNQGMVRSVDRYEWIFGSLRFRRGRIIRAVRRGDYLGVTLCKNGKRVNALVHRLVAEAFIPNPDNMPCVNHRDECKTNNVAWNLEWCTYKYNSNYGTCIKRHTEKRVNGKCSKPVLQYSKDGAFIREWPSVNEIERILGTNASNIANCCRGYKHVKTAGGYVWRYANS